MGNDNVLLRNILKYTVGLPIILLAVLFYCVSIPFMFVFELVLEFFEWVNTGNVELGWFWWIREWTDTFLVKTITPAR